MLERAVLSASSHKTWLVSFITCIHWRKASECHSLSYSVNRLGAMQILHGGKHLACACSIILHTQAYPATPLLPHLLKASLSKLGPPPGGCMKVKMQVGLGYLAPQEILCGWEADGSTW
ncbi:hypothetical protein BDZ91DRAFT_169649 [Kalaharituber pfeilii]|nr:hypothetical protein BDZ91DRAFT_169649 [Kalaharituber pfeilii]